MLRFFMTLRKFQLLFALLSMSVLAAPAANASWIMRLINTPPELLGAFLGIGNEVEPAIILHADKTVAIEHVVKIMDIAYRNKYKIVLATTPN